MKESQKSQPDIVEEAEVIETIDSSSESNITATFNQQNNYHLAQNIDLDKLSILSNSLAELASRVMNLYEKQQQHNISIDTKILTLEETEQKARLTETPYQRKFAFKALNFAMILSLFSLGTSAFFAYLGYSILAGIAITIPIGVGVANILGFKSANQKPDKRKQENKTEDTEE